VKITDLFIFVNIVIIFGKCIQRRSRNATKAERQKERLDARAFKVKMISAAEWITRQIMSNVLPDVT
jgi:hypothetical protein